MRLRDYSEAIPKPMVPIGYRPILWHVMKYYAHFGHKDFILCLGYKADVIKRYFLNYDEWLSNDFIIRQGGKQVEMLQTDIHDWNISFVDTGMNNNIGQRLKAVEEYLDGEEMFFANYSDGLTDASLDDIQTSFHRYGGIGTFLCVKPTQSFHVVSLTDDDHVEDIHHIKKTPFWINGGFFIFRKEIFEYIHEGDELVEEPFRRLIENKSLYGHRYSGFWASMDTLKERQMLEEMYTNEAAPWVFWKKQSSGK